MTDASALKYGRRNVAKLIQEWEAHRQACRAQGTPLIQETLDAVEEHIDYAYRYIPDPPDPDRQDGPAE